MILIDEHFVYCLTCKRTVAREEAQNVFQTGFYSAKFRLGLCKSCQPETGGAHMPVRNAAAGSN
ncbi:MAG TPA: hypothetical protein VF260_11250 [Bacilli bacterium]